MLTYMIKTCARPTAALPGYKNVCQNEVDSTNEKMCSGNDYRCIGILGATTGFFCLTTILLAIAVIILLLKYCRRGGIANNAHRASISTGVKGKGTVFHVILKCMLSL